MTSYDLKKIIKDVPDFPQPGIVFHDISPILSTPEALTFVTTEFANNIKGADVIVGPDARGFIFGTPLAFATKKPFVMVRKANKLPGEVESFTYNLEYGSNILEMQKGAIKPGQKVILIDDLLATGGTIGAIKKLVESQGGQVMKALFVIELTKLNGRSQLPAVEIVSLVKY